MFGCWTLQQNEKLGCCFHLSLSHAFWCILLPGLSRTGTIVTSSVFQVCANVLASCYTTFWGNLSSILFVSSTCHHAKQRCISLPFFYMISAFDTPLFFHEGGHSLTSSAFIMENVSNMQTVEMNQSRSMSIPMYEQSTFMPSMLTTCANPGRSLLDPRSGSLSVADPSRSIPSRPNETTSAMIARKDSEKSLKAYAVWKERRARSLSERRRRQPHRKSVTGSEAGSHVSFADEQTQPEKRWRSLPICGVEDLQSACRSGENWNEKTHGGLRNRSVSTREATDNGNVNVPSLNIQAGAEQSGDFMTGPGDETGFVQNQFHERYVPEVRGLYPMGKATNKAQTMARIDLC